MVSFEDLRSKGEFKNVKFDIKAGIKKENIKENSLESLFDLIDRTNQKTGKKDGILDEAEVQALKSQIETFAKGGRNKIFSEKDAKKFLKSINADPNISASDLFELLDNFANQSKEIVNQKQVKAQNQNGEMEDALQTEYKDGKIEIIFADGTKITKLSK